MRKAINHQSSGYNSTDDSSNMSNNNYSQFHNENSYNGGRNGYASNNNNNSNYNNNNGSNYNRTRGINLEITEGISSLSKSNAKLERMFAKIGTKADTADFRDRMHKDQTEATELVKNIMNNIKKANQDSRVDKTMIQQLSNNFKREFQTFQRLQDQLDSKQIQVINSVQHKRNSNSSKQQSILDIDSNYNYNNNNNNNTTNNQYSNQQLLSDEQFQFSEYNAEEIERRTVEIHKIERQVGEVAEMFRDLQELVNQQQEHIDIIDNNITQTRDQTEAGQQQLMEAEKYQAKARRRKCCIVLILLVVIGAIIGIVYVAK